MAELNIIGQGCRLQKWPGVWANTRAVDIELSQAEGSVLSLSDIHSQRQETLSFPVTEKGNVPHPTFSLQVAAK